MDGTTLYRIALGDQKRPDPWQLPLATDVWPRVLVTPTGSGKTAAVTLGWTAHRLRSPDSTPRGLIWCLPMRTLVDQTAEAVQKWFGRLAPETRLGDAAPAAGRAPRGSQSVAGVRWRRSDPARREVRYRPFTSFFKTATGLGTGPYEYQAKARRMQTFA